VNRGIIGLSIGVLVIIILVIVILQLTQLGRAARRSGSRKCNVSESSIPVDVDRLMLLAEQQVTSGMRPYHSCACMFRQAGWRRGTLSQPRGPT
jgi:hypothetical protein